MPDGTSGSEALREDATDNTFSDACMTDPLKVLPLIIARTVAARHKTQNHYI
jgi:hypothetical protein